MLGSLVGFAHSGAAMKKRFTGPNKAQVLDALKRQEFASGDDIIAEALRKSGKIVEFKKGKKLVRQNGSDDDIYFLISGNVGIVVNGNQIAERKPGETVGEMAAIETTQKRAADVIALDTVVALKVSSADFMKIGKKHPQIWLPICRALSRRLHQRNSTIPVPNEKPRLFVISSVEALDIANQIQASLQHDVLCTVWTNGVFFASGYPLEALEKAVDESDFAVAIAQADDIVDSRGNKSPTLRDNVVFELGLFMGKLTRHRTILVHPRKKGLKLPSDLHGLTMLSFQPGKPSELSARLGPSCTEIRTIVRRLGVRKLIP